MSWLKMISRHLIWAGIVISCLAVIPMTGEAAEPLNPWENKFTLGLGTDFTTGTYGSHKRTDTVSVPLTIEWRPHKRIDVQLSLPYIYQSNSVNPAFKKGGSGGTATAAMQGQGDGIQSLSVQNASPANAAVNSSAGALTAGAGNQGSKGPSLQATGTSASGTGANQGQAGSGSGSGTGTGPKLGQISSQDGIGDMTLQVGIAAVEEEGQVPEIRMLGYVKFPTGNRSTWLGSGEFDEGGGLSLSKSYGDLHLYLEGIWIFQGGSEFLNDSGITVKDYLNYYTEIGYQATESLVPALVLKGTTATSEEQGGTFEGQLKLSWKMTEHTSFQGYIGTGFNDATADLTAGASLFYNF